MATTTMGLTPALQNYLLTIHPPLTPEQERLREETATRSNGGMQIPAEQGHFMGLLVRMIGAKRCLEVGVFTGYSSLAVAMALPEDGKIIALDISDEFTQVARRYWKEAGVEHKIDLHIGPALESLETLLVSGGEGTFDFAFIDADKPNYPHYYEIALQLLRPGGVLAIDNTLWAGRVADPEAQDESTCILRQLNETVRDDVRVDSCLIPIGDGVTLAVKK